MHGQWAQALNRDNDKINLEITDEMNAITIIDIDKCFFVSGKLITIILEIETYLQNTQSFTLSGKIKMLKNKKLFHRKEL